MGARMKVIIDLEEDTIYAEDDEQVEEEIIIENPTAKKIKKLVDNGIPVYWSNCNYEIIKDEHTYMIKAKTKEDVSHLEGYIFTLMDSTGFDRGIRYLDLTDRADKLLNTHEKYFYMKGKK